MPTLEHNALIEMFRENPGLAPHLLSLLFHLDVPSHATAKVADSTLDQLIPIEFRADLVLELRDDKGKVVQAIVLEVQRDEDPRKKYSWPAYVAVARAERECSTVVFVVALDAQVAAWASETIALGLGLGSLQPLVLGPARVPLIVEPTEAEKEVELTILSAMVHGNGPKGLAVVMAALGALGRFDHEHAAVYFQIVYDGLREPMRRALEAFVMERRTEGKATFPPFAQQLVDRGLREGELKGKREALLRLMARMGIALGEEERARIEACTDGAILDRWFDNVFGAKAAKDILS